jgi:energy-coupling factor transport system substrate-specific component
MTTPTAPGIRAGGPPAPVFYGLLVVVGLAAFLYPFWIPAETAFGEAHAADAPFVAAAVGLLAVLAISLEVRRGTTTGATIAVLAVLSAMAGVLRLVDLPGGGSGIFFLIVLAGAAYGPRFGLLLGLGSMATSALLTGGMGPWLPFQMLALAWMGAGAGFVGRLTRRLPTPAEVVALAGYGWVWGFVYGAIMNIWFWPYLAGQGALAWEPGLGLGGTLDRYWSFYSVTSLAWDAAAALTNAVLILITGRVALRTFRRFESRLVPSLLLEAGRPSQTGRAAPHDPYPSADADHGDDREHEQRGLEGQAAGLGRTGVATPSQG